MPTKKKTNIELSSSGSLCLPLFLIHFCIGSQCAFIIGRLIIRRGRRRRRRREIRIDVRGGDVVAHLLLQDRRGRANEIERFVLLKRQGMHALDGPIDRRSKSTELLAAFLAKVSHVIDTIEDLNDHRLGGERNACRLGRRSRMASFDRMTSNSFQWVGREKRFSSRTIVKTSWSAAVCFSLVLPLF